MASEALSSPKRAIALALAAAIARFALEWPLLRAGVYAISDDDFARVTIAQRWVVAPRLDPSGTSWLPAQFWMLGAVGRLFGRSWECMQHASVGFGMLAAAYLAFVLQRVFPRGPTAWCASLAPLIAAWGCWTGACTVPEGYTGLLATAALVALAERRYPWHATLALGVAALSRYEVWPVVGVVALLGWRWKRGPWATLSALAPVAWMAWNAHAHGGDPLHFLARVAKYRAEHAAQEAAAGLHYPAVALGGAAVLAQALPAALCPPRRADDPFHKLRIALPMGALCTVLFLAYGDARGGAPTHHPERALIGVWSMLVVMAVLAVRNVGLRGMQLYDVFAVLAVVGLAEHLGVQAFKLWRSAPSVDAQPMKHWKDAPSTDPWASVFARGDALRGAEGVLLRPCAYEHYALAAAYGAPERIRVLPSAPLAATCPEVVTVGAEALLRGEPLR